MAKSKKTSKKGNEGPRKIVHFLEIFKKKQTSKSLDNTIDEWMDRYHRDAEEAVYELLVLIIEIAGGDQTELGYQDYQDLEIEEAAEPITEIEDSPESYPLVSKRVKSIPETFPLFWAELIRKVQASILHDSYFLEMVVSWLKYLAKSKRRGLRHASTIVSVQLIYSLIETNNALRADKERASRQQRQKEAKEIEEKYKVVDKYIKEKLFDKIISVRFSDALPEIRVIPLMPLAEWVHSLRSMMGEKSANLKYLGRALNDWIVDVRMAAVKAVAHLYEQSDIVTQVDLFTSNYKHRIEAMAIGDKNPQIAVEAIKLIQVMEAVNLIDDEDLMRVCALYQVNHEEISMEAGNLIFKYLLESKENDLLAVKNNRSKKMELREEEMRIVIDFLDKSSQIPNIPYYLVNSLWALGYNVFTDWEFYRGYLTDLENRDINDAHLIMFLKIMKASIQISVGDKYQVYTDSFTGNPALREKTPQTKEEARDREKFANEITSEFIEIFPVLLTQYKSNIKVCEELIDMCRYFTLETYIDMRLQAKFKELMDIIKEIFILHPYSTLADTITLTIYKLVRKDVPSQLESESRAVIYEIFKTLITRLKSTSNELTVITNEGQEGKEKEVEDLVLKLVSDLNKLNSISKQFSFDDEEYDSLLYGLMKGLVNLQVEEEQQIKIIQLSSSCYASLITWTLYHEYAVASDKGSVVPALNDKLLTMFYLFSDHMIKMIEDTQDTLTSREMKLFAYKLFTETRMPFSPALDQTALHIYDINLPIQSQLKNCSKQLLEQENQYNIKYLKQNYLKELLDKIEKKKLFKLRFQKKSSKKKTVSNKSDQSGAETTDTSHSEKETSHGSDSETGGDGAHDSDSDETKKTREAIDKDLDAKFQEDPSSVGRVDDILLSMMRSIQCEFVTPRLLIEVLKQVAFSPSEKSLALIKEFVHSHPLPNDEAESSIIVKTLVRFHKICLSPEVSGNSYFQNHFFSRLNALAKWLTSEAIHNSSLPKIIMKSIRFIHHEPNLRKGREFISVIEFMAAKLSSVDDIDNILNDRDSVVFDKRHKYLPFIEKLYNYIESIKNDLTDKLNQNKKKSTNKRKSPSSKKSTSTTKQPVSPSKKKSPAKRKAPSKKWESSDEEDEMRNRESSEESEEEMKNLLNTISSARSKTRSSQQTLKVQPIVSASDKESSEDSEDFEPSPYKKRKTNSKKK